MGQNDSNTRRPSSLFERLVQGEDPLFAQIDRNAKSALSRLDVVSRYEFDAQTAVLQRTRERLEALEAQIAALSEALESHPTDKDG
jgi:BMFP domain-containing protein YqiC